MLNLWNSGFSTIDSIHIHNNMPVGNNTSTRPVSKPGQPYKKWIIINHPGRTVFQQNFFNFSG
jgi:hypothetical protein